MKKTVFFSFLVILLVFCLVGCNENPNEDFNEDFNEDSNENKEFIVTFDLNGGNINGNINSINITIIHGETIINLPEPNKQNGIFIGWFFEKNGSGNEFTINTKINNNVIVYAKWENPFVGKWIRESDLYEINFDSDMNYIGPPNVISDKGIYSFNQTELIMINTHIFYGGEWHDNPSLTTTTFGYFIQNSKMELHLNDTITIYNKKLL